jgi:hypothetical protein
MALLRRSPAHNDVASKAMAERSMRKLLCLFSLLTTLVGPSFAAEEQSPDTIADVRCLAVGLRISQSPDPAQKNAGLMVTLYYLGRLDGRTPTLGLEDLIAQEIEKMNDAVFRAEAMRCGNHLTVRGQQLTEIGEDLVKRGQALQQQPTPSK